MTCPRCHHPDCRVTELQRIRDLHSYWAPLPGYDLRNQLQDAQILCGLRAARKTER